jgi:hypothetical protein
VRFFAAFWVILVLGFLIHWWADRRRHGPRPHRAVELLLVWVVVLGGLWTILAGLGLAGGGAHRDAISGGYTPSMYAGPADDRRRRGPRDIVRRRRDRSRHGLERA